MLFIQSTQQSSVFLYINFLLLQGVNREVECSSILNVCYSKEVGKFSGTNALIVKSCFPSLKCGIFLGHVIPWVRFCHYTKCWN